MSQFIQLHLLTSYPPSNLNRDDLGRPKTAMMGGALRLRVSSQSLKRAWRTSSVFQQALSDHIGTRTKRMGLTVYEGLRNKGVSDSNATKWAQVIAGVFGAIDKGENKKAVEIQQLAHFSPEEQTNIDGLIATLAARGTEPTDEELKLLRKCHSAVDIALFGRMLADASHYNMEAAAQVAHAISVHRVAVEDDFFTAVDDLNAGKDDMGAGHMGETEFAAGLFYLYVCINRTLLEENLSGDANLTDRGLAALVEASATVSPTGKQNSFGSRAYASYILCERGDFQPRSLSVAFLKPTGSENMMNDAITSLRQCRENMNKVYGIDGTASYELDATSGEGSLGALIDFAKRG